MKKLFALLQNGVNLAPPFMLLLTMLRCSSMLHYSSYFVAPLHVLTLFLLHYSSSRFVTPHCVHHFSYFIIPLASLLLLFCCSSFYFVVPLHVLMFFLLHHSSYFATLPTSLLLHVFLLLLFCCSSSYFVAPLCFIAPPIHRVWLLHCASLCCCSFCFASTHYALMLFRF
jgi:hypothetical protein